MANHYTKFAFAFAATPEEYEALVRLNEDLSTELTEDELEACGLDLEWSPGPNATLAYINGRAHVSSTDGDANLEATAILVQKACPSSLPFAFSFAWSCDKHREDAFGGGVCLIRKDDYDFFNTNDLLEACREESTRVSLMWED